VQATLLIRQVSCGRDVRQVEAVLARRNMFTLPTSAINLCPIRRFGLRHYRPQRSQGPDLRGVRQQFVKVGGSRGDQVAVISGVKPGDEVVTSACSSFGMAPPFRSQ